MIQTLSSDKCVCYNRFSMYLLHIQPHLNALTFSFVFPCKLFILSLALVSFHLNAFLSQIYHLVSVAVINVN